MNELAGGKREIRLIDDQKRRKKKRKKEGMKKERDNDGCNPDN